MGIEADVTSDCAPLWGNVKAVMDATHELHVIRDATRGGVGTVLYEIAGQSQVGIPSGCFEDSGCTGGTRRMWNAWP